MEHFFYHGTSSLFLSSIVRYGLGGINPNIELKLLELLKFLYELSNDELSNDEDYIVIRDSTKAMAFQESLSILEGKYKGSYNYNHNNIYLSFGIFRAMIYAVNSEYGSEILTRIIVLYRLLRKKRGQLVIPSHLNVINIDIIEKQKFFPLLIGMSNINPLNLRTEYGEPAEKYFSIILKMREELNHKTFWERVQYYNFQLLKPIPAPQLTFYKVLYTGNIGSPSFIWSTEKI